MPRGVVSFERKSINPNSITWQNSEKPFKELQVHIQGSIEDEGHDYSEVDFANKYIGGGVITSGCVQEEIRFLLSPGLIVSRLFTECLADNEAMVITGVERFNRGEGYSSSFRFKENYVDRTSRDSWGRRYTQIIVIDAIDFENKTTLQFDKRCIDRELNKAYCGFKIDDAHVVEKPTIATGKWGCGAFGGDPYLKCLIQLMAASNAERDLVIFTNGDSQLAEHLQNFHQTIKSRHLKVGSIYRKLLSFKQNTNNGMNIIEFILNSI